MTARKRLFSEDDDKKTVVIFFSKGDTMSLPHRAGDTNSSDANVIISDLQFI